MIYYPLLQLRILVKTIKKILSELSKEEVIELTNELKDVYGFVPPEPVVVEVEKEEVIEEKTTFTVKLEEIGGQKLALIKLWKELSGLSTLSLIDCKKLIESVPVVLEENVSKARAMEVKEALEALTGVVSIS